MLYVCSKQAEARWTEEQATASSSHFEENSREQGDFNHLSTTRGLQLQEEIGEAEVDKIATNQRPHSNILILDSLQTKGISRNAAVTPIWWVTGDFSSKLVTTTSQLHSALFLHTDATDVLSALFSTSVKASLH